MATDITTRACTRDRGLQAAAALTVFFFTATALAQTPAPAPVPPTAPPPVAAPTTPTPPKTTSPTPPKTTPPTPPKTTPPTAPSTAPAGPDERGLGDEIPTAVEAPPSETPPPTDVAAEPPPAEAPPPETPPPPPETVGPPPPPPAPAQNDSIVVKDQEAANDMRRKGLGIMIAGGVITLAGAVTSIAFTVRGTQYEGLLLETEEAYNRANCSGKAMIKPGGTCEQLSDQVDKNRASIDFDDRATRVAGAAIAAGVLFTVAGGIIYRLGVNKLKAGNFARVKMAPAIGRNFGGLMLTGRF